MSIFDILGNEGIGGIGDILGTISGQAKNAQNNFNRNITSEGGLGSLLGAGALGALLGNVAGGSLLKNAALLGAGAVALNFYKKWAQGQAGPAQAEAATSSVPQLDQGTMDLIARAMIYAARSDGTIDAEERGVMNNILTNMAPGTNFKPVLKQMESETIDPAKIAAAVRSPEQAEDIFRLSCSVINPDQYMEKAYLDALAQALRINDREKTQIEKEASDLRRQIVAQAR